jgi:hypothetical protein
MIADQAISSVMNNDTKSLNALLDAMTDGDFEYDTLGGNMHAQPTAMDHDGTNHFELTRTQVHVDLTKHLKKIAKRLIYSAVLATNVYVSGFLAIYASGTDGIEVNGTLTIDYMVRPKQARML